jgi:hypothetical protein
MTVTVMRDTIVCHGCGGQRVVTHRQRRRSIQVGGILCNTCRGVSQTRKHSESDLRFWLRQYGVTCPTDTPVREFIAAGGAPHELVQLAQEVYPDAIVTE